MSTCYGGWLIEAQTIQHPCTFYGHIGPVKAMNIDDVNSCFMEFYDSLFDELSIDKAIESMKLRLPQFSNEFAYITCHEYFNMADQVRLKSNYIEDEARYHISKHRHLSADMTDQEVYEHVRGQLAKSIPAQFETFRKAFFHEEFDRSLYIKD